MSPNDNPQDPKLPDEHGTPRPAEVHIVVNGHPVVLNDRHQSGASIEAAAMGQGVPIQLDFVLSEVLPNGHQKVIPAGGHVTVKDGDEFWAIPGDDNS